MAEGQSAPTTRTSRNAQNRLNQLRTGARAGRATSFAAIARLRNR